MFNMVYTYVNSNQAVTLWIVIALSQLKPQVRMHWFEYNLFRKTKEK